MDIVRELDISVVFGGDHFRVGQGELGMRTYNEKHHWVFPLAPTACAYTKMGGYFLENAKKRKLKYCKRLGDFGCHLEVRNVAKSKSQRLPGKWENPKTIIPDMEIRCEIPLRGW